MAGYSQASSISAYRSVAAHGSVFEADPHQLITMLLDGALERLLLAKTCIQAGRKIDKTAALHRVVEIFTELRNSLDHSVGGGVSDNLENLYEYMTRRVLHANLQSDVAAIDEVRSLLTQIRDAWKGIPMDARAVRR